MATSTPPRLLRDGLISVLGGMNSGVHPSLLPVSQIAFGQNIMVRGGFADTRFGLKERALTFENTEQQAWFEDELFQGAGYFAPNEKSPMLIASVGGRIFKIDVINGFRVSEITPQGGTSTSAAFISPPIGSAATISVTDTSKIHLGYPIIIGDGRYTVTAKTLTTVTATNLDATGTINITSGTPVYYLMPNMSLLPKTWMLHAETYFIIQNGFDGAIIYDGATARRAIRNGLKLEVPTGTAMAYWNGRIWVAVNKREIEAGDIFGGPTTIIDFTETLYLAEGGRFRVPSNAGDITALKVLPVLDASLGQGPLQIHTRTSISTLNLPVNRDRWKEIDQPVQPLVALGYGATSDKSTVAVNTDLFLRATDALRSYRMARQEEAASWSSTGISKEMTRIMKEDSPQFLQYSSATLFENLLLFTVNPLPFNSGRAAYWRGLGVLDFDPISGMGQKSPPVYAGLWSGVNIMQIVTGVFQGKDRCFLFVRNAENKNELWELDPSSRFDSDGGKILWSVELRAMDFGKQFALHRVMGAEMWVDNVEGEVDLTLQYRKDQNPCWHAWGEHQICAKVRQCASDIEAGTCFTPSALQPGYKTRIGFGQPPSSCDTTDDKPTNVGYTHQIRIQGEGAARLRGVVVQAYEEAESLFASCT